ncbi:MAG: Nif3-like dinuclear metal center hexameric protein, partial [Desulfovibrionaceae bacterium]|nr:Nif3-like dinuclear metal center hexameric protein [Desulfovibrionaceae bacterium]
MKCPELIKLLEETAPPEAAASWDNSGIQIPGTREEIKCLAVALDPSVANLEKALSFGADFVLCHHPLLFKPVFLHENANYACIVRMLMQAGVWLYSAHTSLDAQPVGPVRWLADELNLSGVCLLEPLQVGSPYGFGFCGDLPEPMQFDAFMQLLSVKMPVVQVRICGPRPGSVKRVACCPGSGSSLWPEALALGADILITGDVKY